VARLAPPPNIDVTLRAVAACFFRASIRVLYFGSPLSSPRSGYSKLANMSFSLGFSILGITKVVLPPVWCGGWGTNVGGAAGGAVRLGGAPGGVATTGGAVGGPA